MYNTLAAEQIAHVLGNAGCRVVLCEEQFAARLIAGSHGTAVEQVVCVDGLRRDAHPGGGGGRR